MTLTAFGTLMALEPAFGLILGLLILSQRPTPVQLAAIAVVVLVGTDGQRGGCRINPSVDPQDPVLLPSNSQEPK